MSYCKFENTYHDLVDCYNTLCNEETDNEKMSEREQGYMFKLISLSGQIYDDFETVEE